jgi:hypothetical protein
MAHEAMSGTADGWAHSTPYPVHVTVQPTLEHRNKLTVAFRPILAIPPARPLTSRF